MTNTVGTQAIMEEKMFSLTSVPTAIDVVEAGGAITKRRDQNLVLAVDVENGGGSNPLHRNLKARHATFLSLGAALGTGLLIGTGTGLVRAGPVGLFICFVYVGSLCYGAIVALGEMAAFFPTQSGFPGHGTRFVSKAFGGTLGLVYWIKYALNSPTQFAACAVVMNYWLPNTQVNNGVWIGSFIILTACVQLLGVRWFGEFEFFASSFKILVLVGLIIMGVAIDLGGGPSHDRLGFRYWRDTPFSSYLFNDKLGVFLGVWAAMVSTIYSYAGTETVGIALGEMKNPTSNVARAVRGVFVRILVFYIGSVFVLGLIVSPNSPALVSAISSASNASASPWVVAINAAGIKILPHIVNACILTFVFSAAISDVYVNSRTLYMLSREGNAPKIFMKTNQRGTPYVALIITLLFCLLAFTVVNNSAYTIFKYFVNAVTLFATITWLGILFAHLRFMQACKKQGLLRSSLPYRNRLNPYLSYWSFFGTALISVFKGFDSFTPAFNPITFVTNYVAFPVTVIAFIGYRWFHKSPMLGLSEIDLTTDIQAYRDAETEEAKSATGLKGWIRAAWSA